MPPSEPLPNWHERHVANWRRVLAPMLALQGSTPLHILEVGSYAGHSSAWFVAELLGHPESTLICCDSWHADATNPSLVATVGQAFVEFRERIEATGRVAQVEVRRGTSQWVLPELLVERKRLDLCYIDGSHEARDVLFDSALAVEMLLPGGVIIWDDYRWRGGIGVHAPRMAIDAVLAVHGTRLRVLHRGVQVVAQKVGEAAVVDANADFLWPYNPNRPVDDLPLGQVAKSGMRNAGIRTLAQLTRASERDLAAGHFRERPQSLQDVKRVLGSLGLRMQP